MSAPLEPTPDLIFFRLRLVGTYPVREDADGVGFETIRYYLIINTIKNLYCAVLREIVTTCDYAVTNCHGNYFSQSRSEILPKMPSPFDTKIISIKPLRFVGDWWRTAITTDDDATSPIRLNQWREAKERKVRGLE
jgi:hypothetical protein